MDILASKDVNVTAYMQANTEYTPVLTQTTNTTDTTDPNNNTQENDDTNSSGAGCDLSGLGIFAFAVLTLLKKHGKK